jgi:hypothetical protein
MKVNSKFSAAAVVIAASIVLVACGGGNSPTAAVKGWFDAMNAGKLQDANAYLSDGMREMMTKMDGGKSLSDDLTNQGTMTKLEIVSEEVRGEGATVKARVHFKDGSVEDQNISLVQENKKWKITM